MRTFGLPITAGLAISFFVSCNQQAKSVKQKSCIWGNITDSPSVPMDLLATNSASFDRKKIRTYGYLTYDERGPYLMPTAGFGEVIQACIDPTCLLPECSRHTCPPEVKTWLYDRLLIIRDMGGDEPLRKYWTLCESKYVLIEGTFLLGSRKSIADKYTPLPGDIVDVTHIQCECQ